MFRAKAIKRFSLPLSGGILVLSLDFIDLPVFPFFTVRKGEKLSSISQKISCQFVLRCYLSSTQVKIIDGPVNAVCFE